MEFLGSSNLEILNRGNEPTFSNAARQEVLDITLGSDGLLDSIADWEVSLEPSLSDHRHILFHLRGSFPMLLIRNPRGTNWDSFRMDLRRTGEGPPDEHERRSETRACGAWLQRALISAYEDNCPLRNVKAGKKPLRWTRELESLRREVRRLFNKCRADNQVRSWELSGKLNRNVGKRYARFPKRLGGPSVAVTELPRSARLHRALSKGPTPRLGSLVTPDGKRT